MALHLAKFDPSKDFVTAAPLRAAGKAWGKGFPFDKNSIDPRTLRLLYEQRKLVYADGPEAERLIGRIHNIAARTPAAVPEVWPGLAKALGTNPDQVENSKAEAETEAAAVKRLVDGNSHAKLLEKASGIAGVKKSMKKAQIATVLVRHGRAE